MVLKNVDMASNSDEFSTLVKKSSLPDNVKESLLQFIQHFPNLVFYQEEASTLNEIEQVKKVKLPEWLRQIRQILASVMPNHQIWVQFNQFNGWSPRSDRLNEIWYTLHLRGYVDDEEREFLESIEEVRPFPIGEVRETGESILAINLANLEDKGVYEYNIEDLWDNAADGEPVSTSIRKVFDSYADIFSYIAAIKIQNGEVMEVITAKGEKDR
jgi:hypothetical protein